jgi:ceramide glucosyltransferase
MASLISNTLLVAIALGLLYGLVGLVLLICERAFCSRRPAAPPDWPPVSIFKPLKGVDDQLYENLQSFFQLEYPRYELIFGLADEDDPALPIVRALMQKYPHVDCHVVIDRRRIGLNPKVSNLYNMYERARYDHFVISDSNVRVGPGYVTDVIGRLSNEQVGLVTSLIRGRGATSAGAALENIHLNSFIATGVIAARRLIGMPIAIGKSMCFRRQTLKRLGGFAAFANHLAEDHLLSQRVRDLGLAVLISPDPVDSISCSWGLKRFVNRHLRWATIRRHASPTKYAAEILSNPILLSLVYWGVHRNQDAFALALGACALKVLLDMGAAITMGAAASWFHYTLVPGKDLIIALLWFVPFLRRTVNWRGNRMRIADDTRLMPLPPGFAHPRTLGRTLATAWHSRMFRWLRNPLLRLQDWRA